MITDTLEKFIQGKGIRVGFMEGEDARVLEAVYYLKEHNTLVPVLLGDENEILENAKKFGFNIDGIEIINPKKFNDIDKLALRMVSIRRGK